MTSEQYPSTGERTRCAPGGAQFRIRPIRPDDSGQEREFINILSPKSRYQRCMRAVHESSSNFIQGLVNVDYQRTMSLVAVVGEYHAEQIIGVAHYAATDAQGLDCEFFVAVADVWQLRGVGAILMRLLFAYARSQGFTQIYGPVVAADTRLVELAHDLRLKMRHLPEDGGMVEA